MNIHAFFFFDNYSQSNGWGVVGIWRIVNAPTYWSDSLYFVLTLNIWNNKMYYLIRLLSQELSRYSRIALYLGYDQQCYSYMYTYYTEFILFICTSAIWGQSCFLAHLASCIPLASQQSLWGGGSTAGLQLGSSHSYMKARNQ